jgi:signal transduction histidine kinase
MRLRTRLRATIGVSVVAVLAMSGVVGWSLQRSNRASSAADIATSLQRDVLERIMLRDEFLLYREARARRQWEEKTSHLLEALGQARSVFRDPTERRIVAEMENGVEGTRAAFHALAAMPDERTLSGDERVLAYALRERLTSSLLLLSYDLYTSAGLLEALSSQAEKVTRRATLLLLVLLVATVLATTTANAVLTGGLLARRIGRLREGAERLAAGDLAYRLSMRADDELAELARTFDDMATRVQEGTAALDREVAERREANTRLDAANKELEAFSYSVSHDLRAPLRHVAGFVNLLEAHVGGALDEKGRHYLEVISSSAVRMGALIDDLLTFSRTGRSDMHVSRVGVRPLLDEVIGALEGEVSGRDISWAIGPLPDVVGDPAMLRQVWFNLVANALKFSRQREHSRIEIGGLADPADGVQYWIKDNGVGFDMRYADKLFGVFQRLHPSERFEGTGVGLAIVQRIVARHGGRVWAEGKTDEGAVFRFALPAREGHT